MATAGSVHVLFQNLQEETSVWSNESPSLDGVLSAFYEHA
jgi:hypothetical protein